MSSLPQRIGSYILEEQLGYGATSEVWLARHALLEARQVALKVLMAHDDDSVRRFRREALLASRLKHPHIVQVYDHGFVNHFHFTALEYVPGGSLRQVLEREKQLPLEQALRIFKQVAAALDYAHVQKVIHRDVSPGNILVDQTSGRAFLTDFGIAREPENQSITFASMIMGTRGFLSPEHLQSATAVTHLSDIFSLGVVLYFMLTGVFPWDELPDPQHPAAQRFDPPLSLRRRGFDRLPSDLDQVFLTLLAPDPLKRYPAGQAAVEALDRIFVRHTQSTEVVHLVDNRPPAEPGQFDYQASGVEQNPVETLLGPDLIRAPIARAHQRAEELRNPARIAELLDAWSQHDTLRLRRRPLGRLARLHQVTSRNVYFYRLRVLYEQRSPTRQISEPDYEAKVFPIEPALDRWQVTLPPVEEFVAAEGKNVVLPGSTRVTACKRCEGKGSTVCKRCKGKQRIYVNRSAESAPADQPRRGSARAGSRTMAASAPADPAATSGAGVTAATSAPADRVLIPCPDCEGRGGIRCDVCDAVSRLIERQAFDWRRFVERMATNDDLPDLDERWLHRNFKAHPVYSERASNGFRPEWSLIAPLGELIAAAQSAANADQRIVLTEVTINFIPVSDIVFDLGHTARDGQPQLYRLSIYGFEDFIPPDWRFLNWERVIYVSLLLFMLVLTAVFGVFAFLG